ncbi:bifunctional 3'-5' exonuclease/ATP-dependent helicase WRN-like [Anopheles nili]|uniref:bifunctional 3'-5' exonuclease/ATP-dependent helicase WRN-like n=1 Tax=Anopheles nili TaxID=185578 RepID=UPI00237B588E|nr:bifunctional 3'-5' exonuclease/ATP-dependent helicase WRN-like [Anopheles nili]
MSGKEEWPEWSDVEEGASVDEPGPEHLVVLSDRFGHSSFRPMQWRIIRSIIDERRDNCVIMATGYGKSLTYQFPSVFLERLSFVVSPLISLMEDQVLSLNLYNIPACLLGTAQRANPIPEIKEGAFRVVYLTPEFVTGDSGQELLRSVKNQLALIAIDEAHCLSKWGHDFRPAYRNLNMIRKACPNVPILAVTATATPKVKDDIIRSLQLVNPQVLCTGFDRPNLEFIVRPKGPQGPLEDIRPLLMTNRDGSAIIYCLTRKQTDEITELLRCKGFTCEAYHAGLSLKQRRDVHESFVKDRVQIIVATIAFGMGIDKPDVRLVIHYGASKDLESYYQEAGRAGRDGQPSRCVMFWCRADFKTHEFLRSNSYGTVQNNLEQLSRKMSEYLDTRSCRRDFILQYFEGTLGKMERSAKPKQSGERKCCDNCTRGGVAKDCERYEGIDAEGQYDFAPDAELLLKALGIFYGGTGFALPIMLLRGSKNKKLNDKHYSNALYGKGKARDEEWWKALGALLEREGYLKKVKIPNSFNKFATIYHVQITPTGQKWLDSESNNRKLLLKPTAEMFKSLTIIKPTFLFDQPADSTAQSSQARLLTSQTRIPTSQDLTQEIVKLLLKKRSELAMQFECMPYMIASNTALHQMATRKPLNLQEMKKAQLDGFSDAKLQKFGWEFLVCIQQKLNLLPSPQPEVARSDPPAAGSLSATKTVSVSLWKAENKSLSEIATIRKLAESTVISHICDAIRSGVPYQQDDLVRLGLGVGGYATIASRLPTSLDEPHILTKIKEMCPPEVTFNQIKLVLACEAQRKLFGVTPDSRNTNERTSPVPKPPFPKNTTEGFSASLKGLLDDDEDDDDGMFDLDELDRLEASFVNANNNVATSPPSPPLEPSSEKTLNNRPTVVPNRDDSETLTHPTTDRSIESLPQDDDVKENVSQAGQPSNSSPTVDLTKNAFRPKAPSRRPVNLKRIIYDDEEEDEEDEQTTFRFTKRKP